MKSTKIILKLEVMIAEKLGYSCSFFLTNPSKGLQSAITSEKLYNGHHYNKLELKETSGYV